MVDKSLRPIGTNPLNAPLNIVVEIGQTAKVEAELGTLCDFAGSFCFVHSGLRHLRTGINPIYSIWW